MIAGQAMVLNTVRGTALEGSIDLLGITSPASIHGTMLCNLLLYCLLFIAAFLAVRHLHKEKR